MRSITISVIFVMGNSKNVAFISDADIVKSLVLSKADVTHQRNIYQASNHPRLRIETSSLVAPSRLKISGRPLSATLYDDREQLRQHQQHRRSSGYTDYLLKQFNLTKDDESKAHQAEATREDLKREQQQKPLCHFEFPPPPPSILTPTAVATPDNSQLQPSKAAAAAAENGKLLLERPLSLADQANNHHQLSDCKNNNDDPVGNKCLRDEEALLR